MLHALVLLLCQAATPTDEAVGDLEPLTVEARLQVDGTAAEGARGRLSVHTTVAAGWSVSRAGVPEPILQVLEPASARLTGPQLDRARDLANNEFLRAPHERLVKEGEATVEFELTASPGPDERFEFNLLAYLTDGDQSRFVRLRRTVALRDGATAEPGDPRQSRWGKASLLHLGDPAEPFDLPRADGSRVSLEDHLGESYILVTTYRAHW